MRIALDPARCQGHLRCVDLAPDHFDSDDLGYARVNHRGAVPERDWATVRRAVANCPEGALSTTAPDPDQNQEEA